MNIDENTLTLSGYQPERNVPPITHLGSPSYMPLFPGDTAQSVLNQILLLNLPELVNPAKRYGPLIDAPYWETFAVRPEFYSLVNAHQLPSHLYHPFDELKEVVAPRVQELEAQLGQKFALSLPMMIRIKHPPALNHIDTPVRHFTINWHIFENHDHEVYFGPEVIKPKQDDLYLYNVDYYHGTRHPDPSKEVVFMSHSLRLP